MRADLLGAASVVLLPTTTLAERDLVAVLHRLRSTCLPVVIEADSALAQAPEDEQLRTFRDSLAKLALTQSSFGGFEKRSRQEHP
mgnify:CR=1 FL=1